MPSTASSPSRSELGQCRWSAGEDQYSRSPTWRTPRRRCWPPWIGLPPESSISSTMPPRRSPIGCQLSRRWSVHLKPRRLPEAIVRLAVGGWGLAFLTRLRGADNARARETLNWRPRYSSWRQGFQHEFGQRFPDASGNETVPANAA